MRRESVLGGLILVVIEVRMKGFNTEGTEIAECTETLRSYLMSGVQIMGDIAFLAVTLGFFLVALGYVRGCDRLK